MTSIKLMPFIFLLSVAALCAVPNTTTAFVEAPPGFEELKAQAEKLYAEHSYAQARDVYKQAQTMALPPEQKRWVDFRIADSTWRSQAGTQTSDSSIYDKAREQLDALIQSIKRIEDRDLVWAETEESLGDFWWQRRDSQNWGQGWQNYQAALDWWAGSSELDRARDRYLDIVWKMAAPSWMEKGYHGYGNYIPIEVLDNALKIAVTPDDKSHAHYLIAVTLRSNGDWRQQRRVAQEFEGAIEIGKSADWYDDALFSYGDWLMNTGRPLLMENGQWMRQPDYIAALAVFQRFAREFRKGQSRYWDEVQNRIKGITSPTLSVSVSNNFLPGSEIQYYLGWRNVKQIELSLYRIDFTRDLAFNNVDDPLGNWMAQINLGAAEKLRTWTKDTKDKDDYRPGQSTEHLDEPLPLGAYVLQTTAGGVSAREVIFVTDAALIMKAVNNQVLLYACSAGNGAPIPKATLKLWKFVYDDHRWRWADATKQADENGLCVFDKPDFAGIDQTRNPRYFAAVVNDDRQAIALSNAGWDAGQTRTWRIYAFTDRPAYRPNETVQWKLIARSPSELGFTTPANQTLEYEITDPRNSKISEGTATLNAFGSAWGSVELKESMPLGEYRVTYWLDKKHDHFIGQANLFRLEEYKLPEFQVKVQTPEENGKRKAFVLGDYVEAQIQADYYFGGPVANASVEVIVTQNPYYRWWAPTHDYPWLYENNNPYRYYWGGGGQIVKRETIRTDATGKAILTFETPANSQQDFEYRIEARVTDASRREITSADSVRVTRQRYYVQPQAKHNLYKPNDKVEVDFKAMDANDQPVQTQGTVKVTREQWIEIWTDPTGAEVSGEKLRDIREHSNVFPPPPPAGLVNSQPWRITFRGYKSEDILTTTVKLNEKGEGTLTFTPNKDGYYHVAWRSDDTVAPKESLPILAETTVWVATNSTSELGYRQGGLQLILDKDTFRVGQSAPVMISTPTNDRYVLFTVEGNNLYSYQLVHVTGTVKLVTVPIDQRHVPNIYLNGLMAHDGQLYQNNQEVVIPPVEQYLNIDVVADQTQYQPGQDGRFTIKATDHDGKPIAAEIALSVADEAVAYIQQDYAGDPRQFFFEQRQGQFVQTGSTFNQRGFVKLIKGAKDELIDERNAQALRLLEKGKFNGLDEAEKEDDMVMNFAGGGRGAGGGRDRLGQNWAAKSGAVAADAAAPAPAAASEMLGLPMSKMERQELKKDLSDRRDFKAGIGGDEGPAVQVRNDFRSTLLWQPSIVTDEDGIAKVSLKYADSLTSWKATARAAGKGNQFGIGSTTTRTKMPIIARLQAPRFFLVGDTVTISGVINNNTDEVQTVTPSLETKGLTIFAMLKDGQPVKGLGTIDIPANSEARVDWQINVESVGTGSALLKLTAKSNKYADAMEKSFTIYEHGVERFVAKSGKVRGKDVTVKLDIPSERKTDSTVLMVQVSPSMAVTMLDALPYLIDYPYGCTEQTMSRFLPAAITAKTLSNLGIKPDVAMSKVFGGIEQATADKTHPKGKKDLAKLDEITKASLERLYDFQHSDGGWGWWKEGESDHFMTAYVLWGMCLARNGGIEVKQDAIDRAAAFLDGEIVEEETNYDIQSWMLHALATYHSTAQHVKLTDAQSKAMNNLWTNRDKLNAYTRALLALGAHEFGDESKAKTLIANLENGVKRDERPDTSVIVKGAPPSGPNESVIGTAHWGEDGIYWRWSDGGVEATAFALRAMLAIDPKNKLIEPVTNWLIKNRRGAQWNSTRDTAITVLAMNDYLRISGELTPDLEYELSVNGHAIATKKISAEDVLGAPTRYEIDRQFIRDGTNDIRILRKNDSTSAIYFASEASFFSLEEPVPPSGNEIFVRREYYKLVPRLTLLKGIVYDKVPLADGGSVASGERVQVILTVESKNNYEYLIFEDLKPAGLEAVEVRSGQSMYANEMKSRAVQRTFGAGDKASNEVMQEQAEGDPDDYTGRNRWVYQELRDRKVAMFIDHLPEGIWELRYDLRAETPGRFHALPVMGSAMYVPEIRANSQELRIAVTEAVK